MQSSGDKTFPAKLLLFGEYTVLEGGQALAVPVPAFSGRLVIDKEVSTRQRPEWEKFIAYLKTEVANHVDLTHKIRDDLDQGLAFDSNVPIGYGLGSSGVLVAALYKRYLDLNRASLNKIQESMAVLESYFHGKSSGMDPLVSYTERPLLKSMGKYHNVEVPRIPWHIYLIDSGQGRNTQVLVARFREWLSKQNFKTHCLRPLILHSDHAIQWLLLSQWDRLWEHLTAISMLQRDCFRDMILPSITPVWEASLKETDIRIKLCGAGGGGYYLAFSRMKKVQTLELFRKHGKKALEVVL